MHALCFDLNERRSKLRHHGWNNAASFERHALYSNVSGYFAWTISRFNMEERIKNKGNWFLVEIITTAEPVKPNKKTNPLRRRTVWGNMHLIKSTTANQAYEKGVRIGKNSNYRFFNSDKIEMESKFLGIGDLIPVYEDIEDGCEILWEDYGLISAKRSQSFVRSKKELLTRLKVNQKQNNR